MIDRIVNWGDRVLERNPKHEALIWNLFLPLRALVWMQKMAQSIRLAMGCPNSRLHLHSYQWGMGPDAVIAADGLVLNQGAGWWMYCETCGRRL